jgi:hypothetical protein
VSTIIGGNDDAKERTRHWRSGRLRDDSPRLCKPGTPMIQRPRRAEAARIVVPSKGLAVNIGSRR